MITQPTRTKRRKPLLSFLCCLTLFTPHADSPRPPPPRDRLDRRLVAPPCRLLRKSLRHLTMTRPNHDADVPHFCAGLVHGDRASLPLGFGAGYIGYMGGRGAGTNDMVMRRRDFRPVIKNDIHTCTIYRLGNGKKLFLRLFHESQFTFPATRWRQIGFTTVIPSSIYPTYKHINCNMLVYTRVQPTDSGTIQTTNT